MEVIHTLDTIGLRSPFLSEKQAQKIEQACTRRQGVRMASGELLYSITTESLKGSWDSRISIKIERERWRKDFSQWEPGKRTPVCKMPCEPCIYVEASVHKALLGHNVCGGPVSFAISAAFLVDKLQDLLDCELPCVDTWEVRRIDVAEVYELPSYEAVEEFFRGVQLAEFPRRKVRKYDLTGFYVGGYSTAVKLYHKGPEFRHHDYKRLKQFMSLSELDDLQVKANRILRAEVEIKARKLEYDFGHPPLVKEISDAYLEKVHDSEMWKLLREGADEMKQVRTAYAVKNRLLDVYGSRLSSPLYGVWVEFSTLGEDVVKASMKRATFYKYRKLLVDAGVSWHATDVMLKNFSLVPEGFSPVRSDSRRLVVEAPQVVEKLARYRVG